jgi:peptide/nickel transport system substrate-binding protein
MKRESHTGDHCTPRTRRWFGVIAVLAVLACLALAAGVAAAGSPSPAATGPSAAASPSTVTYRVGFQEPVDSLNPFVGLMSPSYLVYHLVYDFLVGWDPVNENPRPEFAESWTHSADGRTWTFKIRPGMTWSDGRPATARDVAFTFNSIVDNTMSAYALYTNGIKHVTAVDDTTARFDCSRPMGGMLQMSVPILPEHIWSKIPAKQAQSTFQNGPPTVGSGPYQVVENKKDEFVRLVANKNYWRGAPGIDELILQNYTNADSMMADLHSGALDAVAGVPVAQFKTLHASSGITPSASIFWSFAEVAVNCYDSPDSRGNPVLRDQRFRQALQYALDRQKILQIAFTDYADAGQALMPPYGKYTWQVPADQTYDYDPAKAKALLEAAGYRDVNGDGFRETAKGQPLTLRLYAPAQDPSYSSAAKLITGEFQTIGLRVRLSVLDQSALTNHIWSYSGNTFTPDYDMYVWYWQGGSDPTFILNLLTFQQIGAWSDTSWTDSAYDKLYTQQLRELDQQKRVAIVDEMQQMVHAASPYLILGYPQQLEAYNTAKWAGYVPVPSGYEGYSGDVLENPDVIDTYVLLHLKSGEATGSGGSRSWIWAVALAAVVAAAVGVVVVRNRRRGGSVEED